MSKPKREPLPEPEGHGRRQVRGCDCPYCKERRRRQVNKTSASSWADMILRQTKYHDETYDDWDGQL